MRDSVVKAHALGNDYLVVDPDALSFPLGPAAVRLLCDRHRGLGSDGVLALAPSGRADAGLRIWNPDGSQAEKSGNGLRIFARWLADEQRVAADRFTVETPGGVVTCALHRIAGRIEDITVDMGRISFRSTDIPCAGPPREVVAEELTLPGRALRITALTIGNPHCVLFVPDPDAENLPALGAALERHPLFPNGTNVQLARVDGRDRVRARIWERGAGETLASGSSACAVAAACVRLRHTDRRVTVQMDGGALDITLDAAWNVRMTGPAVPVYRAALRPAFVAALASLPA